MAHHHCCHPIRYSRLGDVGLPSFAIGVVEVMGVVELTGIFFVLLFFPFSSWWGFIGVVRWDSLNSSRLCNTRAQWKISDIGGSGDFLGVGWRLFSFHSSSFSGWYQFSFSSFGFIKIDDGALAAKRRNLLGVWGCYLHVVNCFHCTTFTLIICCLCSLV